MQLLNKNDLRTFEQLAQLKQSTLKKTLSAYLHKRYSKVIETDQYLCAVGDIPIALVAHMDTVFLNPPEEIFYDTNKNVLWSPDGLGADDRAGVFAILQIIRSGRRPHIIFTTDEEKGATGALSLANGPCPFNDLRYIIELDRRGTCDCVFYECDNKEFTEYIQKFGFIEAWGSFSDISVLCPKWEVAGVNLSIGYRDEHSVSEVLFVNPMLATIEKVKHMLDVAIEKIPKFKYIAIDYGNLSNYRNNRCSWSNEYGYNEYKCKKCGKLYLEEEMFPVYVNGQYEYYCSDCVILIADWCSQCGQAFKKTHSKDTTCEQCKKGVTISNDTETRTN